MKKILLSLALCLGVAGSAWAAGGGIPASVEVIFQDASGAQATAVI